MIKFYTSATNTLFAVKKSFSDRARKLVDEESGATAIEYGLIAAGIAVAIIAIVFTLGNDLADFFQAIDTKLTSRTPT
jgi:pilus assembly protein Flp/PilA